MILSDGRGLDTLKAVRMALLHDLAEAETGDLTPPQKDADPAGFKHAEEAAMSRMLEKLPPEYIGAWREFYEGSSEEARLVRDADKLEMVMQAAEYQGSGGDRMKLMRFWHAEIKGAEAKAIRDSIKTRSVSSP
jgi:putative hydrolase of HD superfamily